MINRNRSAFTSFSLFLLLSLSLAASWSTVARAQNKSIYTSKKHQVTFEPPQGTKPEQTVGGASRGEQCPSDSIEQNQPLTPLLPMGSRSLTVESHPTLLVYVPNTSATQALLSVRDANEDYDYQTTMSIGDRPGIVKLTLPEDAPALDVGREYQWSLILMCDNRLRPDSPVVQGDIMRVISERHLQNKLAQADLYESAAIYGDAGLWYDTLSSLAKLKTNNPKDINIASNWEGLLNSVGLENVAKAEFVE
ncbi:MAG: DUF928 domain-containing protein [Cyanobacteria bacterium J06600_6]